MKNAISFIFCIFFSLCGISQTSDGLPRNDKGDVEYQRVIKIDGKSQKELFVRGLEWIAIAFKSAQDVIQFKDQESGKIIAKGRIETGYFGNNSSMDGHYSFMLMLEFKDNKGRVTINNIQHEAIVNGKEMNGGNVSDDKSDIGMFLPKKYWAKVKADVDQEMNKFLIQIETGLSDDSKSDDEW